MYGGSEVDELCVQSMDWGDKGAHPGERGLNPHEKKKKRGASVESQTASCSTD